MATMSGGWWIDRPPSRHPDADAVVNGAEKAGHWGAAKSRQRGWER